MLNAALTTLIAAGVLLALAAATAALLRFAAAQWRANPISPVQQIDALLPQTQCGQCGYPGCRPYAEAVAGGEAINRCAPGGEATVKALATLLHVPVPALATPAHPPKLVAFIREAECIGCTKCIQACPVDAIVGAAKLMHTVIADECTGCDLCVEPCPVDCIELHPAPRRLRSGWRLTATPIATDAPALARLNPP